MNKSEPNSTQYKKNLPYRGVDGTGRAVPRAGIIESEEALVKKKS